MNYKINSFLLAITIPCLLIFSGCSNLSIKMETEAPEEISTDEIETLSLYAANTINCKREDFSYLYSKEDDLHYMKGCGEKIAFSYICNGDKCFWVNLYALHKRAQFDLQCEEPLTSSYLGLFTRGIVACGKRATYELINGRWIMNSTSN